MCQLLFSVSVAQETVVADALEAVRQHVADAKLAPQLAEIGVILLMFGVGMHSISHIIFARMVDLSTSTPDLEHAGSRCLQVAQSFHISGRIGVWELRQ